MPGDETFEVLEQQPGVVPLGLQLSDLLVLLQDLLPSLVQLLRQCREFLKRKTACFYLGS